MWQGPDDYKGAGDFVTTNTVTTPVLCFVVQILSVALQHLHQSVQLQTMGLYLGSGLLPASMDLSCIIV